MRRLAVLALLCPLAACSIGPAPKDALPAYDLGVAPVAPAVQPRIKASVLVHSIAAAIFALRHLLPPMMAANVTTPMGGKILMAIAVVFPVGMMLGVCFPTGMRLVERDHGAETAWYWALNGVFGVLCSAIAVFVSIYFGISTSMLAGATCYLSLLLCLPRMAKTGTTIELVPAAAWDQNARANDSDAPS